MELLWVIMDDDYIEYGAEKILSFQCGWVGSSVQCGRTLEYVVELLSIRTNQIKVVCITMVLVLERFLS